MPTRKYSYITVLQKSLHALVWGLLFYAAFQKDLNIFVWQYALLENILYIGLMALAFYIADKRLLPAYQQDKKLGILILRTALLVGAVSLLVHIAVMNGLYNLCAGAGWDFVLNEDIDLTDYRSILNPRILADIFFVSFYTVAGLQFRLVKDWVKHDEVQKELENRRLKSELKFLKAQISPHFLFNTLNSLYALAYSGDKQTAPAIMRLSEIMRYMLYECNVEKVALSKEVEYLKGLIELQKLRLRKNVEVNFHIEGELKGKYISPLLLVMLVENSFKHGITHSQAISIDFLLLANQKQIVFKASNPILPNQTHHGEEAGGIGLQNLQKRLELLYPKQHTLKIEQENGKFEVELTLLNHG